MADTRDLVTGQVGEKLSVGKEFDMAEACERMELSREEMIVFIPAAIREIRARVDDASKALQSGDLQTVAINSHTVKSVTASLYAENVRKEAELLEKAARLGECDGCPILMKRLEDATDRLLLELQRF